MTTERAQPLSPTPARGSLRLLIDPVFGPFFGARLLSTAGVWIYNIVAAILVFELSGSALMVGLVSVAQFGPQLVLAPLAGAMADRGDRRRQLVIGRLLVAAGSGLLAIWIWLVDVEGLPGVWPVIAMAFVVGLGFVLVAPAQHALIPALVRPNELFPAITLDNVPPTVARVAGPAIGALVATAFGPAPAFAIAAITNLVFALVILTLDVRTHADNSEGSDSRIRVGVHHLKKDRRIFPLLIGVAAIGIGADPVTTLSPSVSAGFSAGSQLVGFLVAGFGVGAGVAFLFLGLVHRRFGFSRIAPIGLLTLSLGMAATGASPTPTLAVCSLVVAGSGMTVALTAITTQLQAWVPDEIRGRVMALWSVAFLGSRPFAAAINGTVADATAPVMAFLLVAVLVAGAAWRCRPAAVGE